jgi:hypothetical protein
LLLIYFLARSLPSFETIVFTLEHSFAPSQFLLQKTRGSLAIRLAMRKFQGGLLLAVRLLLFPLLRQTLEIGIDQYRIGLARRKFLKGKRTGSGSCNCCF